MPRTIQPYLFICLLVIVVVSAESLYVEVGPKVISGDEDSQIKVGHRPERPNGHNGCEWVHSSFQTIQGLIN